MENSSRSYAFAGAIEPTNCECHKGKFIAICILMHPTLPDRAIATEIFDTEAEAEKNLEKFVSRVANEVLVSAGIPPESIGKPELVSGEGEVVIDKMKKWRRENRPDLH